ncbi:sugar fermentation stimulation protein [Orbus hercynius]|uniref:Sugar fermentation stimulation protein homolog n=1 Tax=Orbus hercynius TaxID=593135 RepID=A0A495RAV8_9GAMM|nr:DNA/RNA nuclease SfsA [Orbus hercynius]RKS84539.1 sugar fermentation stimulation protein [Orbus hercynius]
MLFSSQLQSGILIQRYKRFLADIMLSDGQIITIHCANTGAMTGCANSGDIVWYSTSTNPKRKLAYSWELTYTKARHWICVNTIRANSIVKEAITAHRLAEFVQYEQIFSEVKYGQENSRIDLLLEDSQHNRCYIEVKSVTLHEPNSVKGYFPDAVTTRGQKHLRELTLMAQQGQRAVVCFLVLHSGIQTFSPATHIDPSYCRLLVEAMKQGVEIRCYNTHISTSGIELNQAIPIMV